MENPHSLEISKQPFLVCRLGGDGDTERESADLKPNANSLREKKIWIVISRFLMNYFTVFFFNLFFSFWIYIGATRSVIIFTLNQYYKAVSCFCLHLECQPVFYAKAAIKLSICCCS